jgi:RNA polymerase sigma factor (sigma-70 family)
MRASRPLASAAVQGDQQPPSADFLALESDHSLVAWMALKDQDQNLAEQACAELYRRNAGFLLEWCSTKKWAIYGADAADFVNEAFLRAYDGAASFHGNANWSREQSQTKVRFWLMRILKNATIDRYYRPQADERGARARRAEGTLPDELRTDDQIIGVAQQSSTSVAEVPISAEVTRAAEQILEGLTPIEERIVQTFIEYYNPITQEVEVTSEVRKDICREFKISESTLNVYRMRIRDRLRKKITESK